MSLRRVRVCRVYVCDARRCHAMRAVPPGSDSAPRTVFRLACVRIDIVITSQYCVTRARPAPSLSPLTLCAHSHNQAVPNEHRRRETVLISRPRRDSRRIRSQKSVRGSELRPPQPSLSIRSRLRAPAVAQCPRALPMYHVSGGAFACCTTHQNASQAHLPRRQPRNR